MQHLFGARRVLSWLRWITIYIQEQYVCAIAVLLQHHEKVYQLFTWPPPSSPPPLVINKISSLCNIQSNPETGFFFSRTTWPIRRSFKTGSFTETERRLNAKRIVLIFVFCPFGLPCLHRGLKTVVSRIRTLESYRITSNLRPNIFDQLAHYR